MTRLTPYGSRPPIHLPTLLLLAGGGAAAAGGTLLTWYGLCLAGDACISAAGVEDPKGLIVLTIGAGILALGVAHGARPARHPKAIPSMVAAGAALIGLVLAWGALSEQSGLDPGGGLFLSIAGLVAAGTGAVLAAVRAFRAPLGPPGRRDEADRPATGAPPPDTRGAPRP